MTGAAEDVFIDMVWRGSVARRQLHKQSGKRSNTRQGHVELAVRKHRVGQIEPNFIECPSLTFVDGHCKGRTDWELLARKLEGILFSRRGDDSRQEKQNRLSSVWKRVLRDEFTQNDVRFRAISQHEAGAIANAQLDVHVSKHHIHAIFLEVKIVRRHSRRIKGVEELSGQHVRAVVSIQERGVNREAMHRWSWQPCEHGFVDLIGGDIGGSEDDMLSHTLKRDVIQFSAKDIVDEVVVGMHHSDALVGELDGVRASTVANAQEPRSEFSVVFCPDIVRKGELLKFMPHPGHLETCRGLHCRGSVCHNRQALPKVASEQKALSTKVNMIRGVHEITQKSIQAMQHIFVGHGALVPNDEGGVSYRCSLFCVKPDMRHRVVKARNRESKLLVCCETIDQSCSDASGGYAQNRLVLALEDVGERIVEV